MNDEEVRATLNGALLLRTEAVDGLTSIAEPQVRRVLALLHVGSACVWAPLARLASAHAIILGTGAPLAKITMSLSSA